MNGKAAQASTPIRSEHSDSVRTSAVAGPYPYRFVLIAAESTLFLGALAGAVQLVNGAFTPPIADLAPLGLSNWTLPALWLFASVGVPSGLATWLAWERSSLAPTAALWSSALLTIELLVQIPFVGPSALQAALGIAGAGIAATAIKSRKQGWPRDSHRGPADNDRADRT